MRFYPLLFISLFFLSCSSEEEAPVIPIADSTTSYYKGMDLSFTAENEVNGVQLEDDRGNTIPNLYEFVANRGVNIVRLRLWVDDPSHPYGLENLKTEAMKIKAVGMDFLLDFHYSDFWADPGQQAIPQVWSGLNQSDLENEVYQYTKQVLTELSLQDTPPAIVQIGNETNDGMLWPLGKVYTNGTENWTGYVALSEQAISAVREITPSAQIMIHHAGIDTAPYFYQRISSFQLDYDLIGLSYYPWWHGNDVSSLSRKLTSLYQDNTDKRIMIVETAYPFTLAWDDNLNNIIGLPSQVTPDYQATPVGQVNFLADLNNIVRELPNDAGAGFCYWAPDWVAYPNNASSFTRGSSWENLALFDFDSKELPAIDAFAD